MNIKSKDEIRDIIAKDLLSIHNRSVELRKHLDENFEDSVTYFRALVSQLLQPSFGPVVTKTPKILRKKAIQRIETIPEDEVLQQEDISSADSLRSTNEQKKETSEEVAGGRLKRSASKKAADNIKKQSTNFEKLGNSFDENKNVSVKKLKRENQAKRKKSMTSSSDEEDTKSSSKYSKVDENQMETKRATRRITKKKSEQVDQPIVILQKIEHIEKIEKESISKLSPLIRSTRSSSKKSSKKEINKDNNVTSNTDDIEELSMYEDAIGKPIPIMNSTLKSSSLLPGKVLNTTVVLGRLSKQQKLNETVVIKKASIEKDRQSKKRTSVRIKSEPDEQTTQCNDYNELITDDESSPEVKRRKKQISKKEVKSVLSLSSEDEIPNTPLKTRLKDKITSTVPQKTKIPYKSNALFSPYAKESVKKRVEAFEQAVTYSPKSIDVDIAPRVTRTKTRAMAAAETEAETRNTTQNVAQILARKSLAKAKRISLAKQKKGDEEFKENKEQMPGQITKSLLHDKATIKQTQLQKMTPLTKAKMVQLSIPRIQTPSHAQNLLNGTKALTASRTNIITNVESFIQPPKSISKTNSLEKLEEKRRYEEDARKKREEALRLLTEEKRRKRQEKELKNKLAREAKEKLEQEKRHKTEREREEKARVALLIQEKQREELEKKRHAQLQRAQEKEVRRKLEEQQRLQKVQEQEETERLLVEQKRREQEAEKRKEAEARAQAIEALKQKNQMLAAQAKYKQANKAQVINYVLDSDPDDDQSDDESRPKHEIPYWAKSDVRKAELAMQRYIAQEFIYKFFDTRKCTPDLTELFHGIDRSRLKRTSSAIWKTPPRISMMETD